MADRCSVFFGIAEDSYETSSDIDVEEVRMIGQGFTHLEVRLEGSTRTIVVHVDRELLVDTENVVPSLGPLCSDIEHKTLEKLDDATMSRSIADLALRVSFLTSFCLCSSIFRLRSYFPLSFSFLFRL